MADQAGRFVDHQQVGVFVNDFKQFFHQRAAGILPTEALPPRHTVPAAGGMTLLPDRGCV